MAITVTSAGTINVVPGETYIFDASSNSINNSVTFSGDGDYTVIFASDYVADPAASVFFADATNSTGTDTVTINVETGSQPTGLSLAASSVDIFQANLDINVADSSFLPDINFGFATGTFDLNIGNNVTHVSTATNGSGDPVGSIVTPSNPAGGGANITIGDNFDHDSRTFTVTASNFDDTIVVGQNFNSNDIAQIETGSFALGEGNDFISVAEGYQDQLAINGQRGDDTINVSDPNPLNGAVFLNDFQNGVSFQVGLNDQDQVITVNGPTFNEGGDFTEYAKNTDLEILFDDQARLDFVLAELEASQFWADTDGNGTYEFQGQPSGFISGISQNAYFFEFGAMDGAPPIRVNGVGEIQLSLICFAADTEIATAGGTTAVKDLTAGDLVWTEDNGLQPVSWINTRHIGAAELAASPHWRPIRIKAGALGNGMPTRTLLVSPQHRIMLDSKVCANMFGERQVLAAAKHLVGAPGIEVAEDVSEITYVHFLCNRHEVVFVEGTPTETYLPRAYALRTMVPEARQDLLRHFPELSGTEPRSKLLEPARTILTGKQARRCVMRLAKHSKPMLDRSVFSSSPMPEFANRICA